MRNRIWLSGAMATVLAGCGGTVAPDGGSNVVAPSPSTTTPAPGTTTKTVPASRTEVEQAWRCRGLMSAAFAAKTILKDDMPAELAEVGAGTVSFWTNRAGTLRAPDMSDAELDALTAQSVRVLATRAATELALPDIRTCLDAQKSL